MASIATVAEAVASTIATMPTAGQRPRTAAMIDLPPWGRAASTAHTSNRSRASMLIAEAASPTALECHPAPQSHWAVCEARRRSSSITSTRPVVRIACLQWSPGARRSPDGSYARETGPQSLRSRQKVPRGGRWPARPAQPSRSDRTAGQTQTASTRSTGASPGTSSVSFARLAVRRRTVADDLAGTTSTAATSPPRGAIVPSPSGPST